MVADGDDFGIPVEFAQGLRQRGQRDQRGSVQLCQIKLPLLAHVEKDELVAFIQSALEFGGTNGITLGGLRM